MLTAVGRSSYIVIIVTFLNSSSSSNNLGFSNCLLHIHYIISCGCFRACLSLHHELYLSVRFRSAPAIIILRPLVVPPETNDPLYAPPQVQVLTNMVLEKYVKPLFLEEYFEIFQISSVAPIIHTERLLAGKYNYFTSFKSVWRKRNNSLSHNFSCNGQVLNIVQSAKYFRPTGEYRYKIHHQMVGCRIRNRLHKTFPLWKRQP